MMYRANQINTTERKSVSSGDIIPKIIWEALFSGTFREIPENPGNPRISRKSQDFPGFPGNPRKSQDFRKIHGFLVTFSGF